jgi:hypothetical protein
VNGSSQGEAKRLVGFSVSPAAKGMIVKPNRLVGVKVEIEVKR